MLSWGPPHDPYIAPEEYLEKVNPATLKLRKNMAEREAADKLLEDPRFDIPEKFHSVRKRCLRILEDETAIREMTAGYLASTLALDDYLGDLLGTLEEEGVLDNTIFVFTSDHGDHLGSHGFWGKDTPFQESISVPFLVRYPKKIPASTVSDVLFAPIDIMPTLLGLAEVNCPDVDGKDMSSVMLDKETDARDAILLMGMTHFNNGSMINGMDTWRGARTKQYTYARYEDGSDWLLYDNVKDPYQMRNLAGNPEYSDVRIQLNERLDLLLREAGDAEDTKALYDLIIEENPKRTLLLEMREVNPDLHPEVLSPGTQ
jgi:arylsulfatase A-like enzyme